MYSYQVMSGDPGCKGPILDMFQSSPTCYHSPHDIPMQEPPANINIKGSGIVL